MFECSTHKLLVYTAHMGAQRQVEPMSVSSAFKITGLHFTY